MQSSNINIDDGSEAKVNIATSKNMFAQLEDEDEGGEEVKRPKEIKPAMVTKKKGEREKVAIQREVAKYSKKDSKKDPAGDEDEDDDDETAPAPSAAEEAKKKKKSKKLEE